MAETYPDEKPTRLSVWVAEVWMFKERIAVGDLVAIPRKSTSMIAIGRVTTPYRYVSDGPEEGKHQRGVEWLRTDIPRSSVDQDLLYSLGSSLAVFEVSRNDAEKRLSAVVKGTTPTPPTVLEAAEQEAPADLDQIANDQIVDLIGRRFKGHDLARLVAAVLEAQGYRTETSRPGPDGGIDILAGTGPLGFDPPRLAVQVKSGESPVDVGVLRELQGVMPRFGASQGLIVSWGGFRESVHREARQLFFQVRLWDATQLVESIKQVYEKLAPEMQAELPLKRIWTLVAE